jgi:hypothetical protein
MGTTDIDSTKTTPATASLWSQHIQPLGDRYTRWLPRLFCLVTIWPYAELLTSGSAVLRDLSYADYESYQLPVREFVRDELWAGRFPHWIPWLGGGIPIHATSQLGLLYPFHAPCLLWLDTNAGLKFSLFLHMLLCYWGGYLLGRELRLSPAAAALAGLVMSQSQFVTAHLAVGHVCLVFAYALIPWLLLTLRRCVLRPSPGRASQLALVTGALLLVGQPQLPYYTLLFGACWGCHMLLAEVSVTERWRSMGWTGCGLLLGAGLAAAQWLPTFAMLQAKELQLERGSAEYAATYAMEPRDLLRVAFPLVWGDLTFDIPEFLPPDFPHEKAVYLGWLTLLLALTALQRAKLQHWSAAFLFLLSLQVVIALGNSTPLFGWLCRLIPGLTLFRCPARCLAVSSCLLPLLAGRGLDSLTDSSSPRENHSIWPSLLLALGATNLLFLSFVDLTRIDWDRWSRFAAESLGWYPELTVGFALVSLMLYICLSRLPREVGALVAGGVLSLELNLFSVQSLQLEPPRPINLDSLLQVQPDERFGPAAPAPASLQYSRTVPVAIRSRTRFLGTNEGGVLPDAVDQLFAAASSNQEALLTLAAVRWTLHQRQEFELTPRRALPRCWIYPEQTGAVLRRPLSELSASELISLTRHADLAGAEFLQDEPQQQTVRCRLTTPGWLIVADNITPDWQAEVNGEAHPIEVAFGCFRAVPLSAGEHQVRLVFRSRSFETGLWLCSAACLICVMLPIAESTVWRWYRR